MSRPAPTASGRVRAAAFDPGARARCFVVAMRPHQWIKNLFVLAPLLFGKRLGDPGAIQQALLACAAFCLVSSALYILNDIIDLRADRAHPVKRFRPIASGELPASTALAGMGALLALSFTIAAQLGAGFLSLAAGYFTLMILYCVWLKKSPILDGIVIALGFVMRVVGGALAVQVEPSHWLIVCAFLLALYLAFTKRRQEILSLSASAAGHRRVLADYSVPYLNQVNNILLGAVIVCYALYTVAPETVANFGTDRLIYGSVFVLYGLMRYMLITNGGDHGGDPGKLLLSDVPLLAAILLWALYNTAVIYQPEIAAFWRHASNP